MVYIIEVKFFLKSLSTTTLLLKSNMTIKSKVNSIAVMLCLMTTGIITQNGEKITVEDYICRIRNIVAP